MFIENNDVKQVSQVSLSYNICQPLLTTGALRSIFYDIFIFYLIKLEYFKE